MLELLAILVLLAPGAVLHLAAVVLASGPSPVLAWRAPLDTGPAAPCWTEAMPSDGRFRYARSECVHDMLMELDALAAVGEFPITKRYE